MPVRSNFPKFMSVDFLKVYEAVTYQAKPFFNPSTGSPFFLTVFLDTRNKNLCIINKTNYIACFLFFFLPVIGEFRGM